ncbi:probable ATP-dependent RNA helicase ddx42 [Planococcus citri]|uniref:probable ATP-dependent RNA helicase ddx42 n=1 Tax=Planococcus citri TaxID=170843 RepID=UPI0031F90526
MIKQFEWYVVLIIFSILNSRLTNSEVTPNPAESTSTSVTISTSTSSTDLEENKDTENTTSITPEHTTENNLPDSEPLSKYRRNGLDIDYVDKWEDDRKRYMIEYPNQFEEDFHPYYRDRARFNDKIFPVRIQGCPHYSRDVSRDENIIRSGILQGWLGAAKGSSGTSTRTNDNDKRLEMSPFYVTTATPKTAPSYRNHANSNKPYADYENSSYDKQSGGGNYVQQNKPSKYSNNNYRVKGSASKDYYNLQGGNYVSDERNVNSWQFPQGRNNRLIYYEYNLDDNRRPDSGYYPPSNNDQFTNNNYNQCDVEYEENSRRPTKNNYFNGNRYQQQTQFGGNLIPQSRFLTDVNQDQNDKEYGSYYSSEDAGYQNRNVDRVDNRNTGYEFNVPFAPTANNDKLNFPPPIPPTLTSPRAQFMAESGSLIRDKNSVKSIPFGRHRFNFQSGNK